MADEVLQRDQNHVTVLGGITNDSAQQIRMLRVDPITGSLLVSGSGGGSGTVTIVSVLTANGFSGTVATNTTTPAITLSTSITGLLQGDGTAISAVTIGSGLSFTGGTLSATGGGGGTPGGLNTQLQYNNAGAFGGITGATTNGTSVSLDSAHLLNPTINGVGVGLATLTYPNTGSSVSIAFPTTSGTVALTSQLTSGTVTGTGIASQISYWTGASAQSTVTNVLTDGANLAVGIPTSTFTYTSPLNFQYDALGATAPTVAQGFTLQNLTAATVGTSQSSPGTFYSSNIWGTTLGTSQNVTWRIHQAPVSSTAPVGTLTFSSSTNGAGYTTKLAINSSGSMTLTGVVSIVSGTLTQSNTSNIGLVSSDGIMTVNNTASSSGTTVQISPRFRWSGAAWTGAASQVVSFIAEVLPTSAATPTGAWNLSASINGAAYNQVFSVTNAGAVTSTSFNGVALTAAGSASLFLTQAGTYVSASGSGTVTSVATNATLTGGTITTTGTLGINLTNANTWTGAQTISTTPLTISGNQSATSWTTNGIQLVVAAATLNDSTSTGTVALEAASSFGIPTITSTSTTTFTTYANVYIAGAPVNSTNVTIGAKYSLYVAAGMSYFNGVRLGNVVNTIDTQSGNPLIVGTGLVVGTTWGTGNFTTASVNAIQGSVSTAALLFAGASNIQGRVAFAGTTNTALATSVSYANTVVGSSPVATFTSGTHALLANTVIKALGTVTNNGATVTNTASLYIDGASGATVSGANYGLWVNNANTRIDGNLTLGTAGNKLNITTGSNASVGTATLSGGTVTVNTTAVTASSLIFLTDATTGALTNIGTPTVGTIVAGTSFVINSSNVLDTSNINWHIIN